MHTYYRDFHVEYITLYSQTCLFSVTENIHIILCPIVPRKGLFYIMYYASVTQVEGYAQKRVVLHNVLR